MPVALDPVRLPDTWRLPPLPDPRPPDWAMQPALSAARELPLLGRDALLDGLWARLLRGPGHLAVTGEPGVGATAVRAFFARRVAELGGVGVLVERADQDVPAWAGPSATVVAWSAPTPPPASLCARALVLEGVRRPGVEVWPVVGLGDDVALQVLSGEMRLSPSWAQRLVEYGQGRIGAIVNYARGLAREGRWSLGPGGFVTQPALELPLDAGAPPSTGLQRALDQLAAGEGWGPVAAACEALLTGALTPHAVFRAATWLEPWLDQLVGAPPAQQAWVWLLAARTRHLGPEQLDRLARAREAASSDAALTQRVDIDTGLVGIRRRDLAISGAALARLTPPIAPEHVEQWTRLRMLHAMADRDPATVSWAESLIACAGPNEGQGWVVLAEAAMFRHEPEVALTYTERGLARSAPTFWTDLHASRFTCLRQLGRLDEAQASLDALVAAAVQLSDVYSLGRAALLRCHLFRARGRWDDALDAALDARGRYASLGLSSPVIPLVIGLVLGSQGRLEEVLRLTPSGFGEPFEAVMGTLKAPVALHRAMLAMAEQRWEEAHSWLDRLEAMLALDPLDPDSRALLAALAGHVAPMADRLRGLAEG
jgi:tetratricopeptide (TPR) repeat protein